MCMCVVCVSVCECVWLCVIFCGVCSVWCGVCVVCMCVGGYFSKGAVKMRVVTNKGETTTTTALFLVSLFDTYQPRNRSTKGSRIHERQLKKKGRGEGARKGSKINNGCSCCGLCCCCTCCCFFFQFKNRCFLNWKKKYLSHSVVLLK